MMDDRYSILIVDDDDNVRGALRRSLRRDPYFLYFAASGPAALEILDRNRIDMIVSDNNLPGLSGSELLKTVRRCWPDMMRVMLTSHFDIEAAVEAINHGDIYQFLTKPWDEMELRVTLFLAFERLRLERENERLLSTVRRQSEVIQLLERSDPAASEATLAGLEAYVSCEES